MTKSAADLLSRVQDQGRSSDDLTAKEVSDYYAGMKRPRGGVLQFVDAPQITHLNRQETSFDPFAFIIETRDTLALRYVVQNMLTYTGLPVQLFLSSQNKNLVRRPFFKSAMERGELFVSVLETDRMDARTYNGLLTKEEFWNSLIGRGKALCFQTDSCICPGREFELNDFLDHDYLGADWGEERPHGLLVSGGNGGFSLRDVKVSLDCLHRFNVAGWPGGEDDFFAFHMDLLGAKVGRQKERAQFCTMRWFHEKSFACHSLKWMDIRQKMEFFRYCPEAMMLLNT